MISNNLTICGWSKNSKNIYNCLILLRSLISLKILLESLISLNTPGIYII